MSQLILPFVIATPCVFWALCWGLASLFPPREPPSSPISYEGLEPTRRSSKRLRDGTRIITRVHPSEATGRVYRTTTTKDPK